MSVPCSLMLRQLKKSLPIGIIGGHSAIRYFCERQPFLSPGSAESLTWHSLSVWVDYRMTFSDGFQFHYDGREWRERMQEQLLANQKSGSTSSIVGLMR